MDLNFFENDIFYHNFNININKKYELKNKFQRLLKIFQEYSMNISHEAITKTIKKQAGVVCVIMFAPKLHHNLWFSTCGKHILLC
jgi:hypothetical protein